MIIQLTSIWQSRRHGIECFHGHTHYGIRPLVDRVGRNDRLGCFVDRLHRLVDDFTTRLDLVDFRSTYGRHAAILITTFCSCTYPAFTRTQLAAKSGALSCRLMHSCSAMDRHATRGVPYYRVSRIFMSRIFHPCNMVPHFHVPQFHVSHFQRPR